MAGSAKMVAHRNGVSLLPSIITLAFWRMRQTWRLLLVSGIGIVTAVMLVCAIPLYSQVAMTAGLRSVLNAFPENAQVFTHSSAEQISPSEIANASVALDQDYQNSLGAYIAGTPEFVIQTQGLTLMSLTSNGGLRATGDEMQLWGYDMKQAASHVSLAQGRLPTNAQDAVEIVLDRSTAANLHLSLGSVVSSAAYITSGIASPTGLDVKLRVVGLLNTPKASDQFWHGNDFQHYFVGSGILYKGLVDSNALISRIFTIAQTLQAKGMTLVNPPDLYWYYRLDPTRVQVSDLNNLVNGIHAVQVNAANNVNKAPFYTQTQVFGPTDVLSRYNDRVALTQLPVTILSCLVVVLILFFITMMAELLADDQANVIAILRSRGASQRQIFGSFVTQSIFLGLVAFLLGPLLAIWVVSFLAQRLLPFSDQDVLSVVTRNPLQVIGSLSGLTLAIVVVAVLTMIFAINDATSRDVLALRRDSARSTRVPFWQRLYLDVVAAIIGVAGYGFSLYAQNTNVIDAQVRVLVLTPLTLLAAIFLLLALTLLFLRFFPFLLHLGEWLSGYTYGVTAMLALAQMARAPRRSVRMALLLALSASFAIFTLVFTASQTQRITDVASYQVGSDFSGYISTTSNASLSNQTAAYRNISGVTAASVGYAGQGIAGENVLDIPIQIRAIDPNTYSQAAIWTSQDSLQPLSLLLGQLAAQRKTAVQTNVIPAVVDDSAWHLLNLASLGDHFELNESSNHITFVAIAHISHIPTISDTSGGSGTNIALGGVMIDYPSYATLFKNQFKVQVTPNFTWLRSSDDAASLARVREALNKGSLQLLAPYNDRRAIATVLTNDPLYLAMLGVLAIGASLPIFLALGGSLISSWLNARKRLVNFAVLRALGTSPGQIVSVLMWEQGIVYVVALLLGIFFGAILSWVALPSLIFTGIVSGSGSDATSGATSSDLYSLQNVPPVRIIVPASLYIALAVFVIICILALGIMVRVVSKESASRTLRLNED